MALQIASFLSLLAFVAAECPNACSGHGTCSLHDQCTCGRNWQGNDCSQRTCPFGYAHVDSPKGDLDGSTGTLSGPNYPLIVGSTVYPFGTVEQYPDAQSQEGHFYMECSNKGLCNRDDGTCECFPGYEGTACQRASCPNDCSGHGTCETIKELAEDREDGDLSKGAYSYNGFASDHAGMGDLSGIGYQTYELWDKTLTMGCKCDPGFTGPDCSLKLCRYGVDPLFIPSGYQYSASGVIEYDWDAPHFEKSFVQIMGYQGMKGQFDLVIYDVYGEKYNIDAINYADYDSGNFTSCDEIMSHFPNDKLKDTVSGTVYHEMFFRGGLVSSAYVGGMTKPFCKAMALNQTQGFKNNVRGQQRPGSAFDRLPKNADGGGLSENAFFHATDGTHFEYRNLPADATYGIRYEFDYNRGNPGYVKDLYIKNLIPETRYSSIDHSTETVSTGVYDEVVGEVGVFGYYGVDRQGEVAEYHAINKNIDPTTNRFMYSDDNLFQDGHHDFTSDYKVTLPGFVLQAHNNSANILLSKDVHFYVESAFVGQVPGKMFDPVGSERGRAYKTSKLLIFGREYQINMTKQEWLEVSGPIDSMYKVGPEAEILSSKSKIFRPITNITLTTPLLFPEHLVDYNNITYGYVHQGSNPVLMAYPERVTVKAKLQQRYQYVSECSGRGNCDRSTGLCQCFNGYSNDNCDTQTPVC